MEILITFLIAALVNLLTLAGPVKSFFDRIGNAAKQAAADVEHSPRDIRSKA